MRYDTDVFIVGTGPTGLTAALALATYGVETQVITRYPWLSNTPRAHITNQRAMEVFRDLGVEQDVLRHGSDWHLMGDTLFTTSLAGPEIARIRAWGTGDDEHGDYVKASPSPMADVPQPQLEAVLLRHAAGRGAHVRFSTEYLGHRQDSDGVTVRVLDRVTGVESEVRCRYLIGADGARSQIAQDIGLAYEGATGRATTAYVQFRADLRTHVEHRPSILYWILTKTAGHGEIGMGLLRAVHPWDEWIIGWGVDTDLGEPDFSEASLVERIRTVVGDESLEPEILHTSTWQVNDSYAIEYQSGRVFCGGDAVHRHPPSGGLGSNTSVQDAYNLAWKLVYVLKGWAAPELLESYSEERVPVGRQVVRRANQSRIDFGPLRSAIYGSTAGDLNEVLARLQDTSAKGAVVRDALAPALKLKNYEFNAHGVEHNQRYTSRAIVAETGDPEGWPEDPELVAQPASRSGAKFPHAWLVGADGRRISTLDLAGGGAMTLVTGLSGTAWETAVGRLGLAFLRTAVIDSPGKADLYRTWQRLRDCDEAGAHLIRPDGYVAWRQKCAVRDPEDAERQLRAALGQVLGRGSDWLTPIPNTLEDIDTPSARERIRSTSTITRR